MHQAIFKWMGYTLAGSAMLLIAGCGTPELRPANYPIFSRVTSVAVLPFQGEDGEAFSRELESFLVSQQGRPGVPFQVVTRSDIPALEKEMRYQRSGATDSVVAKIGKMMHVKYVLIGRVEKSHSNSSFTKSVDVCVKPKGLLGCEQRQNRSVYCTRHSVQFRAIPKLIEVESGRVLYSNMANGAGSEDKCSDANYSSENDPLIAARDNALKVIAGDVAPHMVRPTIFDKL